jgi:hypothetical protein
MRWVNIGAVKPGRVPTLACINRASSGLGADFPSFISALQKYVDRHLAPEDRDLHRGEFRGA